MNPKTARFLVQRQDAVEGEWHQLTRCNSLDYARMVALAGYQRRIGMQYRAIDVPSGVGIALLPESIAKAA
jgi:hypothetical protein